MNLLKQANIIEKRAGDWNNVWSENVGNVTGGAIGAGIGLTAAQHLPNKYKLPAIIAGAAGPGILGTLAGLNPFRRSEKAQQKVDDSTLQAIANLIVPGYAEYNTTRRALAKVDDKGTFNNVIPETIGHITGNIIPGSSLIGGIAGLVSPTRSKSEQDAYDSSMTSGLLNLLPGVAGYNSARRMKADYK